MSQQNFSMHVALQGTNPNTLAYSPGGSLGDTGVLSSPHGSLHRNMGSPGMSQRPPSTGTAGKSEHQDLHSQLFTTEMNT